jgi:AAA15 family ATPase/GTPase
MIQELKIKNFLSFKDEVRFSFEATIDKFAEESQIVTINENTRLLRFAIIYGYNASGKSNLLGVLDFLSYFWSVKPKDLDSKTGAIPFKLDNVSKNEPSNLELVFFVKDTKYWYQLELDQHQVYLEKLSYYKTTQPIMLFERTLKDGQSDIQYNSKAEKISPAAKDMISVNCLKNTSFFVARNQVNVSLPIIDAAKDWMKNHKLADNQTFKEDDELLKNMDDYFVQTSDYRINTKSSYTCSFSYEIKGSNNKYLLIVDSYVYDGARGQIIRYATDINNALNYTVIIYVVSNEDHTDVKDLLIYERENLVGATFIGDIDEALFEMYEGEEYSSWLCDLYFMDLDGVWSDTDGNGIYDSHTGDVKPEIIIGRISAKNTSGNTSQNLINFFN